MWMGPSVRVTLREDLTRYDSRLTPGVQGTLIPYWVTGAWGRDFNFGAVRFDNGPTIDMVLDKLEFDPEGVETLEGLIALNVEMLKKTVRNIRITKTPQGKLARITYEFSPWGDGHFVETGTEFEKDALRLLEMFKEWGVKATLD